MEVSQLLTRPWRTGTPAWLYLAPTAGLLVAMAIAADAGRVPAGKVQSIRLDVRSFEISGLESGDLIFRRGRSLVSRAVLAVDGRSEYSHVGVLRLDGEDVYVVHASPGESREPEGLVRIEPLSSFLASAKASGAAVYRVLELPRRLREQAAAVAEKRGREGTPFDSQFDLGTPDRLYCTELIWRAYLEVGLDLVDGVFDELSVPLNSGPYLLPGSILESRHIHLIEKI